MAVKIRDIDLIAEEFLKAFPSGHVAQIENGHPSDDDGLWFFTSDGVKGEVQLESADGTFPFLVENDFDNKRLSAATTEEALQILRVYLK